MNTQKGFASILLILLGLVVIGGGGYFYVQNNNKEKKEAISTQATTTVTTEVADQKGAATIDVKIEPMKEGASFFELINNGGSYRCTYTDNVLGATNTGTVHISKGNLRDENEGNLGKTFLKTILIVRDGYTYTWTSLNSNTVFRKKIIAGVEGFDVGPASVFYLHNREPIDPKFSCATWDDDQKVFDLPEGAEIVDDE